MYKWTGTFEKKMKLSLKSLNIEGYVVDAKIKKKVRYLGN